MPKISDLTAGSASATDEVPVNQSGASKKVTALAVSKLAIEDAISNGVTDKAPSQNAVFDALALKAAASGTATLTVTKANDYGLKHTDGTVTVGTFVDGTLAYLGTESNHDLAFFTNNGNAAVTVKTSGNLEVAAGKIAVGTAAAAAVTAGALTADEAFRFVQLENNHYVGFKLPALSGDKTYTWPAADGVSGQPMVTNGSGALSFSSTIGNASAESRLLGDVVQISTGGPLSDPAADGFLNIRTATSTIPFETAGFENSIQVITGNATAEECLSGQVAILTGDAGSLADGYSGNITVTSGTSAGEGFSGDIILNGGTNADDADLGGRITLNAIRARCVAGFFQPFKDTSPPAGVTPEEGDIYYDMTLHKLKVFNGTLWETITSI